MNIPEIDKLAIERAAKGLPISSTNCQIIVSYMRNLEEHDFETYEHSIRVGGLLYRVGRNLAFDQKLMFLSGVLHDIGKIDIDNGILRKKKGFNEQDMKIVKEHPKSGYNLILPVYRPLAEIVLRHHMHQVHSYPSDFSSLADFTADESARIELFSLYLGLADTYDSCTTRYNEEVNGILNSEQTREYIHKKYPNHSETAESFLELMV